MTSYPSIRNLLMSLFSVDVGLETGDDIALFEQVLSDPAQRTEIERELRQLFREPFISWSELVDNDDYVAYPADDEKDAREYVVETLWNRVFPNENSP
ncbi:hypothetical protein [Vibrio nigripulchritudo]|uniref:hypothetical protein n=1 Tax=Vibrio nigripulchritudo TaxID=28173 RepID=UPI0003B1D725|nr:hypothetical protein [Vibrio nigripulchritudo]CCN69729.1 hypothetical protein VIBNISFn118_1470003 [Vibrio nigripulchritudo SFn118]